MAKRNLPTWTHPLIGRAVRAISAGSHAVGLERSSTAVAAVLGAYGGSRFNASKLARGTRNLHQCFPDWPEAKIRDCAIESYRHLGRLAAEAMTCAHLLHKDTWQKYVVLDDNALPVIEMLRSGQPCVVLTGHCGNWEWLGATIGLLDVKLYATYRPLDLKPLDDWVHETRRGFGMYLVDKFGAGQVMPEILNAGHCLGFTADQNAGDRGMFVPFFGRLTSTYKSIGLMAIRYNVPVVCGHALRTWPKWKWQGKDEGVPGGYGDDRQRYRVQITDVIYPEDWKDQPDPLFYVTARYRRALEASVRAAPEQYLWMHRVWKSRPAFERRREPVPERLIEKLRSLPWMTEKELERVLFYSHPDNAKRLKN